MGRYYIVGDNGVRAFYASEAAGRLAAQRIAAKIGRAVTLFQDHTGAGFGGRRRGLAKPPGSGRVTGTDVDRYTRNPSERRGKYRVYATRNNMLTPQKLHFDYDTLAAAKNAMRLLREEERTTGVRLHVSKTYKRNPVIEEYAEHMARLIKHVPAKRAPAFSKARNIASAGQLRVTDKRGRTQLINMGARAKGMSTDQVAAAYRDAGYTVDVMRRNPAKKTPAKARKSAAHKRGAYVCWREPATGKESRQKCGNKGIATIRANELKRSGYAGVRVIGA